MSIYQDANGAWIYFDGTTKHRFAAQEEATDMASKESFVQKLQGAATQIAQASDIFADLDTIYYDRGYNDQGNDPIGDADISATGLTALEVANLIGFGTQLTKFLNNEVPAQDDYDKILNNARTDI